MYKLLLGKAEKEEEEKENEEITDGSETGGEAPKTDSFKKQQLEDLLSHAKAASGNVQDSGAADWEGKVAKPPVAKPGGSSNIPIEDEADDPPPGTESASDGD